MQESEIYTALKKALVEHDKQSWDAHKVMSAGQIDVSKKTFKEKNFSNWDLSRVQFRNCNFNGCHFTNCDLSATGFFDSKLSNCDFTKAHGSILNKVSPSFNSSELYKCDLVEIISENYVFIHTSFKDCSFQSSEFHNARITNTSFLGSDLSGCSFRWASFDSALWEEAKIDGNTIFEQAIFVKEKYDVTNDKASKIKCSKLKDSILNWKNVRFLSDVPIFGISWSAFVLSLICVNSIEMLNRTELVKTLRYPVEVPDNALLIMISSILIAAASTIYKIYCPDFLQDFTESQWVYEHKNPRPIYLVNSLYGNWCRYICVVLLTMGGLIAAFIVSKRLFHAFIYLWFLA